MSGWIVGALTACWLGILTSLSPCPLATNITAISFVARRTARPRAVFSLGLLYALGRSAAYVLVGALVVFSLLSASSLSLALQSWIGRVLGPTLVLVGMVMLDLLRLPGRGRALSARFQARVERWGTAGALALGFLFALSFCPISAALFFGSLIPLAVQHESGILFPLLYGVGTALPVLAMAAVLSFGAAAVGRVFARITSVETWVRRATGVLFIAVGVYLTLSRVYGVIG
ncbi:MAG: aromatic aminobenezylarsenical efflux permease ArsG family transporter [Candidatus Bipolaricaulota bacterium]